jgi:hypothetical protein
MGYEDTGLLTLYRRHSERCSVHKLKLTPAAKRKYMDCECPLWIYGNTETTQKNNLPISEVKKTKIMKS